MSSSHSKTIGKACSEAKTKPKPMTFGEAMTLEKSNVIAKRHSSNPLFLKLFPMTMTFNMWDVIYRGKRINVYRGIYKIFFIIYRGE